MDRSHKSLVDKLLALSLDDNHQLSSEAVGEVLEGLKTIQPPNLKVILQDYAAAVAQLERFSQIIISSPTELIAESVEPLIAAFSKKYGRPLKPLMLLDKSLLVGLEVRVGDDTYAYSGVASLEQLAHWPKPTTISSHPRLLLWVPLLNKFRKQLLI